jgi:hypothetical protein
MTPARINWRRIGTDSEGMHSFGLECIGASQSLASPSEGPKEGAYCGRRPMVRYWNHRTATTDQADDLSLQLRIRGSPRTSEMKPISLMPVIIRFGNLNSWIKYGGKGFRYTIQSRDTRVSPE